MGTDQQFGSDEFMIAEFSTLQGRIDSLERTRSERTSIFLGGALLVAAAVVTTADSTPSTLVRFTVSGTLAATALLVQLSGLRTGIQVVLLYRRAGRVRCYFHDKSPEIYPYLPWAPGDDTPPFRDSVGYSAFQWWDPILTMVGVVASAVLGWIFADWAAADGWMEYSVSLACALAFLVALILAARSIQRRAEQVAAESYNSHFPVSDRISDSDRHGHR